MTLSNLETVELPSALVQRLRDAARLSGHAIPDVIETGLDRTLPSTAGLSQREAEDFAALSMLNDAQLWAIARRKLDDETLKSLTDLLQRNSTGQLNSSEEQRLSAIVEAGDAITLRKAQAYMLLARRGYRVPMQD